MNKLITNIIWQLSNHCTAECSYCPINLRGGEYPEENWDYVKIANLIVDHYNNKLNRNIDWTFDGGEPLDLHNIARILKTAKADSNSVTLHSNGGKLWMDWWAIEPYVDTLNLSYHYWQKLELIKYIADIFKEKNKRLILKMPVRPDFFDEDMERVNVTERDLKITVTKVVLYNNASSGGGMFKYSKEQLMILSGIKPSQISKTSEQKINLIKEKKDFETKPYDQRLQEKINSSPSYLGKLCNVGIEKLRISYNGYVNGSNCNNQPLGNIWQEGWIPPAGPQVCAMTACMNPEDRKITKFT
jgi:organic radical activating enzyme